MPDINMSAFEEVRRNQLVTEVDIQTQVALNNYQVRLSDIANPTQAQDNVVIDRHGEFLPHWNESLDFDTWVKMSMEIAGKRLLILSSNSNVGGISSGDDTFIQWHGVATSDFLDSLAISGSFVYEGKIKTTSASHNVVWGLANTADGGDDTCYIQSVSSNNLRYVGSKNEGSATSVSEAPLLTNEQYYAAKMIFTGSVLTGFIDDNQISTSVSSNLPNENIGLYMKAYAGTNAQEYSFARKYTATEPTWVADDTLKNISTALKSLGRAG